MLPNDTKEQRRLNLQHQIFRLSIDGPLNLAPVPKTAFRVLEIGCGTGIVRHYEYPFVPLDLIVIML